MDRTWTGQDVDRTGHNYISYNWLTEACIYVVSTSWLENG